jgi:hypothetical protein
MELPHAIQELPPLNHYADRIRQVAGAALAALAVIAPTASAAKNPATKTNNAHYVATKIGGSGNVPERAAKVIAPAPKRGQKLPSLEIGVDDARAVRLSHSWLDNSLDDAQELGATASRIMISKGDINLGRWANYDAAVDAGAARGFDVGISIDCGNSISTMSAFAQYIGSITERYKDKVSDITPCNEPNLKKDSPLPGLSVPCAYREEYDAAYQTIKGIDPGIKVLFGAATSANRPEYGNSLNFLTMVLNCAEEPVKSDGLAYHPYQFTTSPLEPSPAGAIGIGSIDLIEDWDKAEFVAGKFISPNGSQPDIYLKEFGLQVAYRGEDTDPSTPAYAKSWFISESTRAVWLPQAIAQACRYPNIKQLDLFGFTNPEPTWDGYWSTGLETYDGKKLPSYYSVQDYIQQNPQCIKQPPAQATSRRVGSRR